MVKQGLTASKMADQWWSIAIGTGVAIAPIHNQYLTQLTTNSRGETLFFLPAFGYLLLIMGAGLFLLNNWHRVKEVGWGDRRVVGCLLFIVLAISASGAAYTGLQDRFAPMGMGLSLFALYLCGRILGQSLFTPLTAGAVLASLGVVAHQVIYPGTLTGGFVFDSNYDIVVGYILLGVLLYAGKWKLPIISTGIIAMLLTGSPEGIFSLVMLLVMIIISYRQKKCQFLTTVLLVGVVVVGLVVGFWSGLYSYAVHIVTDTLSHIAVQETYNGERPAVWYRLWVIRNEMGNIQPLGTGYNLTDFSDKKTPQRTIRIVHNVPLVIVQQLGWPGVLAGIAWLWVSIFCLVKKKWKYAWVALFALSVWDHFTWTQLGTVWWMLVGLSSAPDNTKPDLLLK